MTDNSDYTANPTIGHFVRASVQENDEFRGRVESLANEFGMESADVPPVVEIEVGDVNWDETRTVTLSLEVLEEMVQELRNQEEADE